MARVDETVAERSFAALAAMRRCDRPLDLDQVARNAFERLGLPWFSLARFYDADRRPLTKVFLGRFEPRWSARYVARQYAGPSLIARRMLRDATPYSWSDVLERGPTDPAQDRILEEAREHGLHVGYFTPVRWTDGSYAAVVVAGANADIADPLCRTMIEVLSSYYYAEARRLLASEKSSPKLSVRQRDCLLWVRHGKSSVDVAEILGISVSTVDEHISEACRKLEVRTRVQAVVNASLAGLL